MDSGQSRVNTIGICVADPERLMLAAFVFVFLIKSKEQVCPSVHRDDSSGVIMITESRVKIPTGMTKQETPEETGGQMRDLKDERERVTNRKAAEITEGTERKGG